jgi:hypothetical protein
MPTVFHVLFLVATLIGCSTIKQHFSEGSFIYGLLALVATAGTVFLWGNFATTWA